ncbi:MAG: hypothetical protein DMD35_16405 [Gemmatimonadetes bacterium]|nr:MAG: hypothetical protein DMD35_16405 [Gemmatimonadota bacterium]
MSTTSTTSTTNTETPLPWTRGSRALLPDAFRLGPVRLAVTELDRAVDFYTRVVGLAVAGRGREGEHEVAHLHAGGEDVVVLQQEPDARPAGNHLRHAGLYHVALNYPTRLELARTLRRIVDSGTRIGASDHATHEAIYLADPDGNGLELAWDRPKEQWPRTVETYMHLARMSLDFDGLHALTAHEPLIPAAAPGLRVGHLHLHVGDVQRGIDFYVGLLGLELQFDLGTAALHLARRGRAPGPARRGRPAPVADLPAHRCRCGCGPRPTRRRRRPGHARGAGCVHDGRPVGHPALRRRRPRTLSADRRDGCVLRASHRRACGSSNVSDARCRFGPTSEGLQHHSRP